MNLKADGAVTVETRTSAAHGRVTVVSGADCLDALLALVRVNLLK